MRPREVAILFVDLLGTIAVLPFALLIFLAPLSLARLLGRIGGSIGFLVWGEARRAGMINLRRAFGDSITPALARRDVHTVFRNLGEGIAEGIRAARMSVTELRTLVRVEDENLAASIVADPRPKIYVTAHLGSWELGLTAIRDLAGLGGAVIARGVDNRFLDALVRRVRFRAPDEWIEKRGGVVVAWERLRRGENLAMLLDENGGPRGPFVPFFGRPASTRKTPALFASHANALIVVGALVRNGRGPMTLRLATIDPPEPYDGAIREATARINAIFEAWIREAPLQWRWIHWRWRTRPDGTRETYTRRDVEACFTRGEDGWTVRSLS